MCVGVGQQERDTEGQEEAKAALWIMVLGAFAAPALVARGEPNEKGKTGEGRSMRCRMAPLRRFWECRENLVLGPGGEERAATVPGLSHCMGLEVREDSQ